MPHAYVALGGSTQRLKAFQAFFDAVGTHSGLAFVVVAHMASDKDSMLAELLARHTDMPVEPINEAVQARPNHVYVIAPNRQLAIENGCLRPEPLRDTRGARTVIDRFFRSLAADQGRHAICVAVSGTDSDGSDGVKAIKAAGGLTVAQRGDEADFDAMPNNAVQSGWVDQVLPVAQIPETLSAFLAHPYVAAAPDTAERPDAGLAATRSAIQELIKRRHGHDFGHYKPGMFSRRVARRMGINRIDSAVDYLNLLRDDAVETGLLLQDLLISVTGFFGDPQVFAVLEHELLPELVSRTRSANTPLRIWVAACATGEEAYSIAIALLEAMDDTPESADSHRQLQVFATDIDERALKIARDGIYPESIADDIPPARLARWFVPADNGYQVVTTLRESVLFAAQNLISDPPFSNLDLICCRNILIDLNRKTERRVLEMFHFALRDGGTLLLGSSETADSERGLFATLSDKAHLFRAVEGVTSASHGRAWVRPLKSQAASVNAMGNSRPPASRQTIGHTVQRLLLDEFAPASVVTNARFEIVYLHGDIDSYLAFTSGTPTDNLLAVARRGLRARVRTMVNAVLGNHAALTQTARVLRDAHYHPVEIGVRYLRATAAEGEWVLVSFRGVLQAPLAAEGLAGSRAAVDASAGHDPQGDNSGRIAQLEDELRLAREDQDELVDELQASNQEFRIAHEQALSMNEELQAANEELETSKEELQSLNEELATLNTELRARMRELEHTNDDIANLLDSTDIATLFLDPGNRIKRFTPATRTLFNLLPADIGRPIDDMSHPFTGTLDLRADAAEVRASLAPRESEQQTRDDRWFLLRIAPDRNREGTVGGVVVSFLDVTRLKRTEHELAASEARFRMLFHDNPAMYFIVDTQGLIVSVNDFGAAQLGYARQELVGESFAAMHVRPARLKAKLDRCYRNAGKRQRWELQLRDKADGRLWIRANARAVPDQSDNKGGGQRGDQNGNRHVFISCENISNEKRLGEEARFHATHDALTGLINRRELEAVLATAIKNARVKHQTHILAYLDLDNFKIINDTYGHQAGDETLRQVSRCMHEALREDDILARVGGDEFAILMAECGPVDANDTARRLIEAIDSHEFLWERHRLRVRASIGLAPIDPIAGGDVESVLRAANAACFAAKELGPSSIHRHTERDNRVTRRRNEMSWANRIREALADGRVRIHLQPIVNVRETSGMPGYEALLRIHDADDQISDAGDFMEAAVRYGLMQELDRFALAHTVAFLSEHRPRLRAFRWIAVNVSAQSLIHPEFLAFARRTLSESDIDPSGLCFEITETSVISNLSQAQHFIREMKRLGCSFALDDFGTGLSSFDYLRVLPVERVKIDGSFIRDMRDNVSDLAMVEAVANITHLMGKTTIAECVENADLLDAVRGVDIDYAQGYHFGEPLPIESLLA